MRARVTDLVRTAALLLHLRQGFMRVGGTQGLAARSGAHKANHMSRRLVMAVPMPTMVHAWMMAAMRCPSAAAQPKMRSHTTFAAWADRMSQASSLGLLCPRPWPST